MPKKPVAKNKVSKDKIKKRVIKTIKTEKPVSSEVFRAPKGMHDILPADQIWWERIEKAVRDLSGFYNFNRIEMPILEPVGLFERTTGMDTDVVKKEMYIVKTKGGDTLALRPEGTPSVVRAYMEHSLGSQGQPQKLYYWGPFFRHEKPQYGRYRQFYQAGFEIIGATNDPIYDAQVILIFDRLLKNLKIRDFELKINSIGCKVCRPGYKRLLQNYYKNHEKDLCADCVRRLRDNPLRLLDCKKESCQEFKDRAPNFLDKLCVNCSEHFKGVLEYLDELDIPYNLDNKLVRGLDYYSQTVFEMHVPNSNVGALPGGGRYDYLMELIGGRPTPAVGGATGIERLIQVMKEQDIKMVPKTPKKISFIHVGELAKKKSLRVIEELRSAGIPVTEALGKESIKSQLRTADKQGSALALIFGQKEVYEGSIILRDLKTGLQETIILDKIVPEIQRRSKLVK
ncbi:MAG: histidine--tRNA ligase [bacterium]|nr:histidine--tRNA ligase [bacterium]